MTLPHYRIVRGDLKARTQGRSQCPSAPGSNPGLIVSHRDRITAKFKVIVHGLDAGDQLGSGAKSAETHHGPDAAFDAGASAALKKRDSAAVAFAGLHAA